MSITRRVRFSGESEVAHVFNLAASECKGQIWFTENELDSFKANFPYHVICVRQIMSNLNTTPIADQVLGLEKFLTNQLKEQFKCQRKKLVKTVLCEDAWHRSPACASVPENEIIERLARISAENSKWARERARAAAMFLEQDQESECLAEERLQEAHTAALYQATETKPNHMFGARSRNGAPECWAR